MLNISASPRTLEIEKKILHSKMNWERGIKEGAMNAGRSVVKRAQTLLRTGIRTGRKYRGLPNVSSAPGEMPRSQSGRLANSMFSETGNPFTFKVGATAPWALFLARGTKTMRPRISRKEDWLMFVINQERNITRNYLFEGVRRRIA